MFRPAVVLASGALATVLTLCARQKDESLAELAARVVEDRGAAEAERSLRAHGPDGLLALLAASDVAKLSSDDRGRVDRAIDRVAGQKYGSRSRLYWHTDLEAAKAEALTEQKPILSLRMLGRLTDELSCANSRFFRTVLYPDPAVAALLSKGFVLHWSSERDVPVITIDFGDGRKLERTVTGNSVHYVLDANGRVLDAIPGLYSPADFVDRLAFATTLVGLDSATVAARHRERESRIVSSWRRELSRAGVDLTVASGLGRDAVPAREAVFIAVAKSVVEAPMVVPLADLLRLTGDAEWDALSSRKVVTLSDETIRLIALQNTSLDAAGLDAMIARFEKSLARDSTQNEMILHRQIHERLASQPIPPMEDLNRWVYAELFATPASDPWLGLHDDTVFTGLEGGGVAGVRFENRRSRTGHEL